jgi:purine-binding chemotaxis protein CheW
VDELLIAEQRQYVLFRLRSEEYGLAIRRVQSIIRYETPTPVPHAPAGVDGVINLRGQVIPLVDLGEILLGEALSPTQASRIIVVESAFGSVGLAVDVVYEVASIVLGDIKPAPAAALGAETSEAFEGVVSHGDRLVILLDAEKALPRPVFMSATAAQEEGADV